MKFLSLAWVGAAAAGLIHHHHGLSNRSTLPSKFSWTSTQPLIYPKSDGRNLKGIKDPSVIFFDGKYHVFASTAQKAGYNLVYLSFTDWDQAQESTFHYLDQTPIGKGYRAAPQIFRIEEQGLWYLVYQGHGASYSTNKDINDPSGWSAPKTFYSNGIPSKLQANMGHGQWVDMWVICDSTNCHMFSSDDNGHLWRAETKLADFPSGFSQPVIALQESNIWKLYEASNVYNVGGEYLLIVEAAGNDGNRYFRSWSSKTLDGQWSSLANTEQNPFIRSNNVKFESGKAWTENFSHGEVVRTNVDQTMTIDPCKMQYLYQGRDPKSSGGYDDLPWKLALLTQNSC
ncbi:hypothetical protein E4U30_003935 [Claviceps sp. LM220 group G6]|nr:hypothetical protein E4U15_007085 [Claviceps sp. LM218 group G6]KAG6093899.1 hypothetical protein E4U30_003935 [Claviceps sp. LM220 group G6]KAG6106737.1 hypothetical protein E4U31_000614 [Claviceps sp. LM219 group G6]KAG6121859.1 hypothetical protein E4U14_001015 [Claviceps sp. LM454 group G7]